MIGSGPGARRRRGIGGETDQRGWISFDIRDTHSLDEGQTCEIHFVRNLALSGLGDLWVERLLGELDPPYRYFFRELSEKRIRRRVFRSVLELTDAIDAFLEA